LAPENKSIIMVKISRQKSERELKKGNKLKYEKSITREIILI